MDLSGVKHGTYGMTQRARTQEASGGSQRVDLIVNVKRSVQQWEAEGDEKEKRTIDPRGIEFLRENRCNRSWKRVGIRK